MSQQQKTEFTQEDKDFLGLERQSDRETLKHGFLRNLDYPVKQQYENIYKRLINPNFVLCFHCSADVKDMVSKLQDHFLRESGADPVEASTLGSDELVPGTDALLSQISELQETNNHLMNENERIHQNANALQEQSVSQQHEISLKVDRIAMLEKQLNDAAKENAELLENVRMMSLALEARQDVDPNSPEWVSRIFAIDKTGSAEQKPYTREATEEDIKSFPFLTDQGVAVGGSITFHSATDEDGTHIGFFPNATSLETKVEETPKPSAQSKPSPSKNK